MREDLENAHTVDHEIELRILHGNLIREVGREVVDDLRMTTEGLSEILVVQDVAFQELDFRILGDVPFVGGGQVVENEDALDIEHAQRVYEVRTNRARAARH